MVHAPRQSGKTTSLLALVRDLCAVGERLALYVFCGRAAAAGSDYEAAESQVLAAIRDAATGEDLAQELLPPDPWPDAPPGARLDRALRHWATRCPLPIVLFLDEIDALTGASLVSVLQQLRDGYYARPDGFPASVVLCGLRDVRDYKAASGGNPVAVANPIYREVIARVLAAGVESNITAKPSGFLLSDGRLDFRKVL